MPYSLLIFDWDGTLIDSIDRIVISMQKAAVHLGLIKPDYDTVKQTIGLGLWDAIRQIFPDISDQEISQLADTYSDFFRSLDHQASEPYSGVRNGLEWLREQGYLLAVATGKSRQGLERVLHSVNMDSLFHCSRCADETLSKPHPQMLNEILHSLKCPIGHSLMVGDTSYDLKMAQNIGMDSVAVSYGAHDLITLKAYNPLLCIDTFDDLLTWLNDN